MEEEHRKTEVTPQEQVIPESIVLPPRSSDYIFGPRENRKSSWPELVGLKAEEAERKIKEEMPEAQIQVIPPPPACTSDLRRERVRLFVDYSGKVTRTPHTG